MYDFLAYGRMVSDPIRFTAYRQALEQTVTEQSVVVDLGAGPGVFALLAAKLGARRVFAIEPDDVIEVGRQAAVDNGLADRIEFIQDFSTRVELPEKADVIVSDLRGVLPFFEGHPASLIDARERFLVPGGVLIPQVDRLWATLVADEAFYRRTFDPWQAASPLRLDTLSHQTRSLWNRAPEEVAQLLLPARCWGQVDYHSLQEDELVGRVDWPTQQAATAHGILVWFESELAPGVMLSNAPESPELVYGRGFFPLQEPISWLPGDQLSVEIGAHPVSDSYVWRWRTHLLRQGRPLVDFDQSTFHAAPLKLDRLRQRGDGYVPTANETVQITSFVLAQVDGQTNVGVIAKRLVAEFPDKFDDWHAALVHVAEVLERVIEPGADSVAEPVA